MPALVELIAQDGDTLDELAWRGAGLGPAALIPLCRANPGLCERITLSAGDRVIVPLELIENPAPSRGLSRISLWD